MRCLGQVEHSRPIRFKWGALVVGPSAAGMMARLRNRSQPSWASRPFSDPLTIRELSELDVCSQTAIKVIPGIIAPNGKGLAGRGMCRAHTQGDIRITVPAIPGKVFVESNLVGNGRCAGFHLAFEVSATTTLFTCTSESRDSSISPRPRACVFTAESGLRNAQYTA